MEQDLKKLGSNELIQQVVSNFDYNNSAFELTLLKNLTERILVKFLIVLDYYFTLAEKLEKTDPKYSIMRSVLDEFHDLFPILDKNIANVNPSFKYIVKTKMTNIKMEQQFQIAEAAEYAKFFVHHALKVILETTKIIEVFDCIVPSSSSKLQKEVEKILYECFRDQHENGQADLMPRKAVATAELIKQLHNKKLFSDKSLKELSMFLVNAMSKELTEINVRCYKIFGIKLMQLYDGRNVVDQYFHELVELDKIFEARIGKIINRKVKLYDLPETAEKVTKNICKNIFKIPTKDADECAHLIVESLSSVKDISEEIILKYFDFIQTISKTNFGVIFYNQVAVKMIQALILPMNPQIDWKQLTNLGIFLVYIMDKENKGNLASIKCFELICIVDNFLQLRANPMRPQVFIKCAEYYQKLTKILGNGKIYQKFLKTFDLFYQLRGKISPEFDKVVHQILLNLEKSFKYERFSNYPVAPSYRAFVVGCIERNPFQYGLALMFDDDEIHLKYFVMHAVFYPMTKSRIFSSKLRESVGEDLIKSNKQLGNLVGLNFMADFVKAIVNYARKLVLSDQKLTTREKVGVFKFVANLWIEGLIANDFILKLDKKILKDVKFNPNKLNLLLYVNFCAYLRAEGEASQKDLNFLSKLNEKIDTTLVQRVRTDEDLDKLDKFDLEFFKVFIDELKTLDKAEIHHKFKNFEPETEKVLEIIANEILKKISIDDEFRKIIESLPGKMKNFQKVLVGETGKVLKEKFFWLDLKISDQNLEDDEKKFENLSNFTIEIFKLSWMPQKEFIEILKFFINEKRFDIVLKIYKETAQNLDRNVLHLSY